ncbi:Uncharacterized protein GBIM_00562 [Gryllus bimaculatus]|nr:Uncharacterized protein GBIM_00562 [Gryllus bimaculatus]
MEGRDAAAGREPLAKARRRPAPPYHCGDALEGAAASLTGGREGAAGDLLYAPWLAYKNMGNRIAGTPFIAFKVPLAEKYHRVLRKCDWFTPAELVESNPGMRLIIDLTNTQRYYSAESVECRGVNYYKLACPGRVVPTENLISRFCDVVHDFLSGCANGQDALIGVHCTHGVNRTGFLICSFMVRHLLMHPSEAISAFELARGHHIERQEYIEALMRQYSKSGAGRKRNIPIQNRPTVSDDTEERDEQSYGFGTLHIGAPSETGGSWTITKGPKGSTHKRWIDNGDDKAQGCSRHTGPDPEAGPSRKRGPNEPFAPFRGHFKGKKDKRTKRNNGQSTSGTEGEDVRSDSSFGARASGNSREDRANANRDKYHQRFIILCLHFTDGL